MKTLLPRSNSPPKRSLLPTSISREKFLQKPPRQHPKAESSMILHEAQSSGKLSEMTQPTGKIKTRRFQQAQIKTMHPVDWTVDSRVKLGASPSSWNGWARTDFLFTDAEACATPGTRTERSRSPGTEPSWSLRSVADLSGYSIAPVTTAPSTEDLWLAWVR